MRGGTTVDAERGHRAAQWCSERCDWECPDRPRPERGDWWWLQGCLDRQEGAKGLGLSVLKPVHRLDRSSLGQSLLAKRNPIICPSPPQPHISPLGRLGALELPAATTRPLPETTIHRVSLRDIKAPLAPRTRRPWLMKPGSFQCRSDEPSVVIYEQYQDGHRNRFHQNSQVPQTDSSAQTVLRRQSQPRGRPAAFLMALVRTATSLTAGHHRPANAEHVRRDGSVRGRTPAAR